MRFLKQCLQAATVSTILACGLAACTNGAPTPETIGSAVNTALQESVADKGTDQISARYAFNYSTGDLVELDPSNVTSEGKVLAHFSGGDYNSMNVFVSGGVDGDPVVVGLPTAGDGYQIVTVPLDGGPATPIYSPRFDEIVQNMAVEHHRVMIQLFTPGEAEYLNKRRLISVDMNGQNELLEVIPAIGSRWSLFDQGNFSFFPSMSHQVSVQPLRAEPGYFIRIPDVEWPGAPIAVFGNSLYTSTNIEKAGFDVQIYEMNLDGSGAHVFVEDASRVRTVMPRGLVMSSDDGKTLVVKEFETGVESVPFGSLHKDFDGVCTVSPWGSRAVQVTCDDRKGSKTSTRYALPTS